MTLKSGLEVTPMAGQARGNIYEGRGQTRRRERDTEGREGGV